MLLPSGVPGGESGPLLSELQRLPVALSSRPGLLSSEQHRSIFRSFCPPVLPPPAKGPCDHVRPAQTTQGLFPVSGCLINSRRALPFCRVRSPFTGSGECFGASVEAVSCYRRTCSPAASPPSLPRQRRRLRQKGLTLSFLTIRQEPGCSLHRCRFDFSLPGAASGAGGPADR